MKICPLCNRDYPDDLGFCLEDGTPLNAVGNTAELSRRETEQFERETFVRQSAQAVPPQRGSNSFGIIAVVVLMLAGVGILLAAGVGGYFYYSASRVQSEIPADPPITPKPAGKSTINDSEPDLPTVNYNMNRANRPLSNTNFNSRVVDPNTEPGERPPVPKIVSGGVLNGKAISLPQPPYPPAARAVRASGSVSVQVIVDEVGNVVSASAVSGHPLLRAAAAAAARGAKFSPTVLSGTAVKVTGVIVYQFRPADGAKIDLDERRQIRREGERPWDRKNR